MKNKKFYNEKIDYRQSKIKLKPKHKWIIFGHVFNITKDYKRSI